MILFYNLIDIKMLLCGKGCHRTCLLWKFYSYGFFAQSSCL